MIEKCALCKDDCTPYVQIGESHLCQDCYLKKIEGPARKICGHQWVKVESRLPDREIVLCRTSAGNGNISEYFVGTYLEQSGVWCYISETGLCQLNPYFSVTHWMNIPKPPEEK